MLFRSLCLLELDTGGDAYEVANISPEQVTHMISDLRDQFTYVIIDCTNYKESVFTGLGLVEADTVMVCIPHRASAATWHIANEQMLEAIGSKTIYVDCDTRLGGCSMERLLASIELPECPVKVHYVDSAYFCENTNRLIVLQGGKQERAYKKSVMQLIGMIISLEGEDKAKAKKAKEKRIRKERINQDTDNPELISSVENDEQNEAAQKRGIFGFASVEKKSREIEGRSGRSEERRVGKEC